MEISYLTALYVRNVNRVLGKRPSSWSPSPKELGLATQPRTPIKELGSDKGQKARFNQCAHWRKECFQSAEMSSMLGKNWEEAVHEELSLARQGAVQ